MTKNLCHQIEHTLFYLWLKYEAIQTNIIIIHNNMSKYPSLGYVVHNTISIRPTTTIYSTY
jgi:hypothetical protein